METFEHSGELIEDLLQEPSGFAEAEREREHIFMTLLRALDERALREDRITLLFLFSVYQKSLSAARQANLEMAEWWLRYGTERQRLLPEGSWIAVEAIRLPVAAFCSYVARDFKRALNELRQSIELFDVLQKNGVHEVVGAKLEQTLNISKIQFAAGNAVEGAEHGANVLSFAAYGVAERNHFLASSAAMDPDGDVVRRRRCAYYFNAVLRTLLRVAGSADDARIRHMRPVFEHLAVMDVPVRLGADAFVTSIRHSAKAMAAYCEGRGAEMFRHVVQLRGRFGALPEYLRFVVLSSILRASGTPELREMLKARVRRYWSDGGGSDPRLVALAQSE